MEYTVPLNSSFQQIIVFHLLYHLLGRFFLEIRVNINNCERLGLQFHKNEVLNGVINLQFKGLCLGIEIYLILPVELEFLVIIELIRVFLGPWGINITISSQINSFYFEILKGFFFRFTDRDSIGRGFFFL